MPSDEPKRSAPVLKSVGDDRYTPHQVADATALTLEQMRVALTPILGTIAVAAFYRRCLSLCAATHICFECLNGNKEAAMNSSSFEAMLAQQNSADARRHADALISTFHTLLVSLIGASLTEQLVGEWTASSMDRNDHQSSEP